MIGCHVGRQEISSCYISGKSGDQVRGPTLALKPRQTLPEVQNRGTKGSAEMTNVAKGFSKKPNKVHKNLGTGRLGAGCPCVYCSLFFLHCFMTVTGIRLRFHKPLINQREVWIPRQIQLFYISIRQSGLPAGSWMGSEVFVVLFESKHGSVPLSIWTNVKDTPKGARGNAHSDRKKVFQSKT